jgi:hypothetical protein
MHMFIPTRYPPSYPPWHPRWIDGTTRCTALTPPTHPPPFTDLSGLGVDLQVDRVALAADLVFVSLIPDISHGRTEK